SRCAANKRLERTRHKRASFFSCVGEPLKRSVGLLASSEGRKDESMKLTLHSFRSDVPREKVCQPGLEYEVINSEVEADQVLTFFEKLIFPRDSFYLAGATDYLVDFWKHEQSIWVEITGTDFWATSEVSLKEATAIINSLQQNEQCGDQIPMTNREWDAYTAREK